MKIIIELEPDNPYELTPEEIEKDIRMGEEQIGWNYDYKIKNVEVTERSHSGTTNQKRD